jgi:hypothetical protein
LLCARRTLLRRIRNREAKRSAALAEKTCEQLWRSFDEARDALNAAI